MTRSIPRATAMLVALGTVAGCGSSDSATGAQQGAVTLPAAIVDPDDDADDPAATLPAQSPDPAAGSGVVTVHPVLLCAPPSADGAAPDAALAALDGTVCEVGPAIAGADVFAGGSAEASVQEVTGGWVVDVELRPDGEAMWNQLAAECFALSSTCPSGQLAIVLDDVIQSAPRVNQPSFQGSVQISGTFTEAEAVALANALNAGAAPVGADAG